MSVVQVITKSAKGRDEMKRGHCFHDPGHWYISRVTTRHLLWISKTLGTFALLYLLDIEEKSDSVMKESWLLVSEIGRCNIDSIMIFNVVLLLVAFSCYMGVTLKF